MLGLAALYSDFNVISVAHQSKKQAYQVNVQESQWKLTNETLDALSK